MTFSITSQVWFAVPAAIKGPWLDFLRENRQGRRAILDYGELLDNAFGPLVKLAWKPRGTAEKGRTTSNVEGMNQQN